MVPVQLRSHRPATCGSTPLFAVAAFADTAAWRARRRRLNKRPPRAIVFAATARNAAMVDVSGSPPANWSPGSIAPCQARSGWVASTPGSGRSASVTASGASVGSTRSSIAAIDAETAMPSSRLLANRHPHQAAERKCDDPTEGTSIRLAAGSNVSFVADRQKDGKNIFPVVRGRSNRHLDELPPWQQKWSSRNYDAAVGHLALPLFF